MSQDLTNGPIKIVKLVKRSPIDYDLEIQNTGQAEIRDIRFQLLGNFPDDSFSNDKSYAIRVEFDGIHSLQSGEKVILNHKFYRGDHAAVSSSINASLLNLTDEGSFGASFKLQVFFDNGDLQIIPLGQEGSLLRFSD